MYQPLEVCLARRRHNRPRAGLVAVAHGVVGQRGQDLLQVAGVDHRRYFGELAALGPWVLDGASPDEVRTVLGELPPPLRLVHRFWWNPRYRKARRWE